MTKYGGVMMAAALVVVAGHSPGMTAQRAAAAPLPVVVIEALTGTIEIELFSKDAPKSVEHIVALVRRGFYRGQRFHRVTASLVQIGDQSTRDMMKKDYWGSGGSGKVIGVAEISKTLTHQRGTVALAHADGPAEYADSQFYIMKTASPSLNGKYAIIGRVVRGMEIVDRLKVADSVKNVYLKGEGPK